MKPYLLLPLFFFSLFVTSFAQNEFLKYRNSITSTDLKEHVYALASDEMKGRDALDSSSFMAAEYIRKKYAEFELQQPKAINNSYYQNFKLIDDIYQQNILFHKGNIQFKFDDHFFISHHFDFTIQDIEAVFLGFGVETEEYSDFKDVDLEGKLAIMLIGHPEQPGVLTEDTIFWNRHKIRLAQKYKAKGVIFVYHTDAAYAHSKRVRFYRHSYGRATLINFNKDKTSTFPVFNFNNTYGRKLIKGGYKSVIKKLAKDYQQGIKTYIPTSSRLQIEVQIQYKTTQNVIGFLEGTTRKDEFITITAHYDHLGVRFGKVYNGADDNASGVAALLEVAQAFSEAAADGVRPERSIVFIACSGEEKGLLGSEYYARNPLFPLEKTILNINLDMVGRAKSYEDNKHAVFLITSSKEMTKFHNSINLNLAEQLVFDLSQNYKEHPEQHFYRSDQYSFYKRGIDFIFYSTGSHDDYHLPTDDADRINYDGLRYITNFTYILVNICSMLLEVEEK